MKTLAVFVGPVSVHATIMQVIVPVSWPEAVGEDFGSHCHSILADHGYNKGKKQLEHSFIQSCFPLDPVSHILDWLIPTPQLA